MTNPSQLPPKPLTQAQVQDRIKLGQINTVQVIRGRSYSQIILENTITFINILLAGVSVLLIIFGKYSDAIIYFSVALINILVGLIQEISAKAKLDSIADLVSPKSRIIRSLINNLQPNEQLLPVNQIVLDDIIALGSGDIIPVDGVVISGGLLIDESILTGESDYLHKQSGLEVFAGTSVVSGTGTMQATKIGSSTMANQINSRAKVYHRELTPIQSEVNLIVRVLFLITVTLGGMSVLANLIVPRSIDESLQIAAVILGVIPNSLFALINLSYALGGVAILKKGALIQRLNAIESLSNVDVLCLDKTGTLTTKNLILEQAINLGAVTDIEQSKVLDDLINYSSELNATTQAIATSRQITNPASQKPLVEIPFNSSYKWSGVSVEQKTDYTKSKNINIVIGASDVILNHFKATQNRTPQYQNQDLNLHVSTLQNQGLRCLIVATSNQILDLNNNQPILPNDLELISLLVFSDQIRDEAKETLDLFQQAGIAIKIISGDNPETVMALAKQIGVGKDAKMISGTELDNLPLDSWSAVVEDTTIFGRITPAQKEILIQTLNKNGHYTAMIGDGVNDVMSIKTAKLGISMESGSPVTRSVADILLLGDSFASLPQGLLEGQKIRNSLEDIFKLFLVKIIYLVMLIIGIRMVGLPFPFSIKQSSLIAIFTTGIPAIGLALWSHPGTKKGQSLLDSVLHFVIPSSISLGLFGTGLLFGLSWLELFKLKNTTEISRLLNFNSLEITQAFNLAIPELQTGLTLFLILAGLCLNIFVSPPIKRLSFGAVSRRDWRPTILSFVLFVILGGLYFNPITSNFLGLSRLGYDQIGVVVSTLIFWVITVSVIWRFRLIDKFLGIKLPQK
ncbi:MAG: HAD-IC family P-type ATPase [Candidatus Parcubacteria bacterium]|nr:HAD-IC family P-type ATPase [Candidatus Paceibacterota bacterium]